MAACLYFSAWFAIWRSLGSEFLQEVVVPEKDLRRLSLMHRIRGIGERRWQHMMVSWIDEIARLASWLRSVAHMDGAPAENKGLAGVPPGCRVVLAA